MPRVNGRYRFVCHPELHRICVIDEGGRLVEVFGEGGTLPGQFDHPSDAIVVAPRFQSEPGEGDCVELVAIADRGNDRVQVFEPQGQLVAEIGGGTAGEAAGREGWPFFRLGGHPVLTAPVRLEWEDPLLVVIGADGARTRLDLAAALLPTFDEWLSSASVPALSAAQHHFRHKVRRDMLAASLAAIETALGRAWLDAGDTDAAARLWSVSWPAALPADARAAHAAERDRAATAAAFRFGSAARVAAVRCAIRKSLGAFASFPLLASDRGGPASREAC